MKRHPTHVYGGMEVQDLAIFPRHYMEESDQLHSPSVLNPRKVSVVSEEWYKLCSYKVYHFNVHLVWEEIKFILGPLRISDWLTYVHAAFRSVFKVFNKAVSYAYIITFRT
jgi:hypothetical protein